MSILNLKVKFFLFPLLVLMISNLCQGQIKVGIRGGLNASSISFNDLPERAEKYGYHLGLVLDITAIPDFLSVQPEISFSTKGVAYTNLSEKQYITMNSVDFLLPVAFKLNSVSLQVGPFVSYLIKDAEYIAVTNNGIILDGFKKLDAGLTAGLSYNVGKLFFGLRYNQGFINVSNDEIIAAIGKGKNAVGQVSVGYWF
jgi:hypothetical protein